MKTIGLIGGMSWESSLVYYRIINEEVSRRLGGLHSAPCILYSFDFAEIEMLMHAGEWDALAGRLTAAAAALQGSGADCLLICTNTMHALADRVQAECTVPLIHIADATGAQVVADGRGKVGLLGTRLTMEGTFYRQRLEERFGLQVVVPGAADREVVDRIIFDELCRGLISASSHAAMAAIIGRLAEQGAEAVILGCTEIPLLIGAGDVSLPLYDTTRIHALAAVEFALEVP
jgi:aspartate racemase